jgi:PAS domain-containing protein
LEISSIFRFKFLYNLEINYFLIHAIILLFNILLSYLLYRFLKKNNRNIKIDTEYKKILDAITDVVFIVSTNGKILFTNSQTKPILGYIPEKILPNLYPKKR